MKKNKYKHNLKHKKMNKLNYQKKKIQKLNKLKNKLNQLKRDKINNNKITKMLFKKQNNKNRPQKKKKDNKIYVLPYDGPSQGITYNLNSTLRRIEILTKHRIDDMPGYIANCDQQS